MAVYKLSAFPKEIPLTGGGSVTARPMTPDDVAALVTFFRGIPDDERYFLKDDVLSEAVIQGWADHLNYDRALPLLAFENGRVLADGLLIRHRGDARSHYAGIRITVDPEYRHRGLGTAIMRELIEIAWDAELESVQAELVAGIQDDALTALQRLGATQVGSIQDAVRDRNGAAHDVVILRLALGRSWQWSRF